MRHALAILCALSILAAQYFEAGMLRPVLAFPAFILLGAVGLLTGLLVFQDRRTGARASVVFSALAFFAWLVWREVVSTDAWLEASYLRLTLACLVIYLAMAFGVNRSQTRLLFLAVLMVGGVVQALFGAAQVSGVYTAMPQGWFSEQLRLWHAGVPVHMQRAHGFYLNANHLSWFLNAMGLMALAWGCLGRGKAWHKVITVYLAVVCLGVSTLTLSRGGILALLAGSGVLLGLILVGVALGGGDRRGAFLGILLGGIVLLAGISFGLVSQNTALQMRLTGLFKDEYRQNIFLVPLRQFQIEPILGTGAGSQRYFSRQFRSAPTNTDDYFAHFDFAQIASDYGFPALALLIVAIILHAQTGWRVYLRSLHERVSVGKLPQSDSAALAAGMMVAGAAFIIHSFFDFNLQIPANALLASAVAGLLAGLSGSKRETEGKFAIWKVVFGRGLAFGVGVWLLCSCWQARGDVYWLRSENAFLKGQLDTAIAEAKEGLLVEGGNPWLHSILARSFVVKSDGLPSTERRPYLLEAKKELELAIAFSPWEVSNYNYLSEVLLLMGNLPLAEKKAVQMVELEPLRARGYEVLGFLKEKRSDDRLAERFYNDAYLLSGKELSTIRLPFVQQRLRAAEQAASQSH